VSPVFGATGYGEQFQNLAQGQPAIVPARKRQLLLHTLIFLALLAGAGWLGWQGVTTWIESGRPRDSAVVGVLGVIAGVAGLTLPLLLLVRPRRLVLTRDRFAELVRRHGTWTEVFDLAWKDVRSIAVEARDHRLIRLSFAYGSPRRPADLLDSARNGLIG
jgi:hypothetical protein